MNGWRRPVVAAGLVLAAVLVLGGCAAGANPEAAAAAVGFWPGLWHGIILPVTFVVSLFTDTVSIYEVANNGNWYDAGFVLGLALFSGPAVAARGRRS